MTANNISHQTILIRKTDIKTIYVLSRSDDFLREDSMTEMLPTIVARRIIGSASMKTGNFPDVRVTKVDESRIRPIPEVRMTSAV